MKFINYVLYSIILLLGSMSVSAQKYKTPADMVKLNQEYVEKIRKLKINMSKKQQRLKDLDVMRAAIYAQLPSNRQTSIEY